MKLQSMPLPTGEFLLVASEVRVDNKEAAEAMTSALIEVRELAGAVAGYATDQDVEVVDALVDENAVRHELSIREEAPRDPWKSDGVTVDRLIEQIADGRQFTPAGLVVGRPGDPDLSQDWELLRGGTPGADPEPEIVVAEDATETLNVLTDDNAMEGIAEAESEPQLDGPEVKPGDRVKITRGLCGSFAGVGGVGTVIDGPDKDGDILVKLPNEVKCYASGWELAQDPELRPNYADDTQLVDIVARAMYEVTGLQNTWNGLGSAGKGAWRRRARRELSAP